MADNVRFDRLGWLRSRFMERDAPDDQGIALIIVVILATVMSMIAAVIVTDSTTELRRSTIQVDKTSALQAAQAGIDDYTAKMTQDSLYYFHYVNQAEPQRTGFGAPGVVTAGTGTFTWTGINPWTYAAASPRRWVALGTQGFEYSLKITAPSVTDVAVTILATGRKVGDPNVNNWRAIQTRVHGSSVADFQVVVTDDYPIGSGATTNGRIYSTHSICHDGIATADLLAEVRVNVGCSGPPTVSLQSPGAGRPVARIYDSASAAPDTLRSQIPGVIDFSNFTNSLGTIKAVALSTGLSLTDTTTTPAANVVKTWRLVFQSNGTVVVSKCTGSGTTGTVVESSPTPPAGCVQDGLPRPVPIIGAIFADKPVLVSGVIKGRVTLANESDIFIGGNITYQTAGSDILGLIAKNNITVPQFALDANGNLTWYSAAIAMEGTRQQGSGTSGNCPSSSPCPGFSHLEYVGSIAEAQFGNGMSGLFDTRTYSYDNTLQYLQPPFFPVITTNYQVLLFREITPTA